MATTADCKLAIDTTHPMRNESFWAQKLNRNRERDRETTLELRRYGWRVIRVRECADPVKAANRVQNVIRQTV